MLSNKWNAARFQYQKPIPQPNYSFAHVPKADGNTLSGSIIQTVNQREDFQWCMAEMILICKESIRRRRKSMMTAAASITNDQQNQDTSTTVGFGNSKPLSLEYIADRMDIDDPCFGYIVRTNEQLDPSLEHWKKGMIQGFITVTTFTNWQKSFTWDSNNPMAFFYDDHHLSHHNDGNNRNHTGDSSSQTSNNNNDDPREKAETRKNAESVLISACQDNDDGDDKVDENRDVEDNDGNLASSQPRSRRQLQGQIQRQSPRRQSRRQHLLQQQTIAKHDNEPMGKMNLRPKVEQQKLVKDEDSNEEEKSIEGITNKEDATSKSSKIDEVDFEDGDEDYDEDEVQQEEEDEEEDVKDEYDDGDDSDYGTLGRRHRRQPQTSRRRSPRQPKQHQPSRHQPSRLRRSRLQLQKVYEEEEDSDGDNKNEEDDQVSEKKHNKRRKNAIDEDENDDADNDDQGEDDEDDDYRIGSRSSSQGRPRRHQPEKKHQRQRRKNTCDEENDDTGNDDQEDDDGDDDYRIRSRSNSQGRGRRQQPEKQRQRRSSKRRLDQQQETPSKLAQKRPRSEDTLISTPKKQSLVQELEIQQPQQIERVWDKGGKLSSKIQSTVRCGDIWNEGIVWPRVAEISLLGALGCGKAMVSLVLEDLEHMKATAKANYDYVVLQATDNSISFYETLGFVRVGTVMKEDKQKKNCKNNEKEANSEMISSEVMLYTVKKGGESMKDVAKKFKVDVWDIIFFNPHLAENLSPSSRLLRGTDIYIPVKSIPQPLPRTPTKTTSGTKSPNKSLDLPRWHIAKENETPRKIAKMYKVPCKDLVEANQLRLPELISSSRLKEGTRIKVSHFDIIDVEYKPYSHWSFPDDDFEDGEPSYMMVRPLNRRSATKSSRPIRQSLKCAFAPFQKTDLMIMPFQEQCVAEQQKQDDEIVAPILVSCDSSMSMSDTKSSRRKSMKTEPVNQNFSNSSNGSDKVTTKPILLDTATPRSAYTIFLDEHREILSWQSEWVGLTIGETSRTFAELWKDLPDTIRSVYDQMAQYEEKEAEMAKLVTEQQHDVMLIKQEKSNVTKQDIGQSECSEPSMMTENNQMPPPKGQPLQNQSRVDEAGPVQRHQQPKDESLFNKIVRLQPGVFAEYSEYQYWYVLTYIPDLKWCHLAPLIQVGTFGSDKRTSAGRPKYKLVDESLGHEVDISAGFCIPVKSKSMRKTLDADKEEWDVMEDNKDKTTKITRRTSTSRGVKRELSSSLLLGDTISDSEKPKKIKLNGRRSDSGNVGNGQIPIDVSSATTTTGSAVIANNSSDQKIHDNSNAVPVHSEVMEQPQPITDQQQKTTRSADAATIHDISNVAPFHSDITEQPPSITDQQQKPTLFPVNHSHFHPDTSIYVPSIVPSTKVSRRPIDESQFY